MAEMPDLVRNAFAVNGDKGAVPPQSAPDGLVNFNDGYTTAYEMALDKGNPLARPVARQTQNYLFYQMSMTTKAWQQMTFAPWYSGMPNGYEIGAHVYAEDSAGARGIFRSTINNNVNEPKNLIGWEYVPLPSQMWENIPMPSGGGIGKARVLQLGVNLRTLARGTYVLRDDAVAVDSQNVPIRPVAGATPIAGMIEVMGPDGPDNNIEIRFHDRLGNTFTSSSSSGVWTPWQQQMTVSAYQQGAFIFAGDSSGGSTALTVNTLPAFAPVNGSILHFTAHINVGAGAALAANGTAARPIVGQDGLPLVAGTIVLGSRVTVQFRASTNVWVVTNCTASPQINAATHDSHAVNLGQLNQILEPYKFVQWSNVLNKPRVAIWADDRYFATSLRSLGLNLLSSTDDPELSGANDAAWRFVVAGANGNRLDLFARGTLYGSFTQFPAVPNSSITRALEMSQEIRAWQGLRVAQGQNAGALMFTATDNTVLWDLKVTPSGVLSFNRNGAHVALTPTGRMELTQRPLFNGAIPYDSRNFRTAGMIVPFGAQHNQVGWIYCDGRALQIVDYPALYAVIGKTYGGTTTSFNVPDMRGYVPKGWGDASGRDSGRVLGTVQEGQTGGHTHTATSSLVGNHQHLITGNTSTVGDHTHAATVTVSNGGVHMHPSTITVDANGWHAHEGVTNATGAHTHQVKEGHNIPLGGGNETLTSGDDYTTVPAYYSTTTAAGDHQHSVSTYGSGTHTHSAAVTVGWAGDHTHTAVVTNAANGGHSHVIQALSQGAGEHSHAVTVNDNAPGTENRVPNVAFPFYISTGELNIS